MSRFPATARRTIAPAAVLTLALSICVAPAAAVPKKFRVHPGTGIGPVSVGDTRNELDDRLGKPKKEGPVWRYTVRGEHRSGVVKVLFAGRRAKNVFTVDPAFVYRGVHVGMDSDQAVARLRGAGFVRGRCGPARAMFLPDQLTMFGLYRGEVEHIFVVRDSGACER
jgi:hypothetical protein